MRTNSLKIVYTIIFGLFTLFSTSYAACNTCSEISYAACMNSTSYRMCLDGKTQSGDVRNCPANTICTDKQGICLPKDSSDPGCPSKECNVCSGIFRCLSEKHYGYCDSTGNNVIAIGECEDDQYCSIEYYLSANKAICGKKCDTTPTCSNTEYTTAAPTTAKYEDSCIGKDTTGYYPLKDDSTCTKYVLCEKLDNVMNSVLMTCKSGYFDSVKQMCVDKKPSNCV